VGLPQLIGGAGYGGIVGVGPQRTGFVNERLLECGTGGGVPALPYFAALRWAAAVAIADRSAESLATNRKGPLCICPNGGLPSRLCPFRPSAWHNVFRPCKPILQTSHSA